MASLVELCLEITNRCIMHCLHCSTASPGGIASVDELSFNEVRAVISDFHSLGGEILEISGGEPTLHKHLMDIVAFAKSRCLETRLYTCGVYYEERCRPLGLGLLKKLHKKGLDKIIFNLQGARSEIHDVITATPGSFDALYKSIMRAKELGFWVGVHFVPMKPNVSSFEDVLILARELAVDEVALLRFVPQGRGGANQAKLKLASKDLWGFLKNVAHLMKKYEDKLKIRAGCPLDFLGFINTTLKPHSCKAGKSTCNITSAGDVIPCPGFKHFPEFVAGNVKTQQLGIIWNTSEVFKKLERIDYKNISICSECEKNDICKGRCPAQRVRYHGHLEIGPDPDCPRHFISKAKPKIHPVLSPFNTPQISELFIG